MTTPRLYGPFQLTEPGIDAYLVAGSSGVYALGYSRDDLFIISYLGRADGDLRTDLKTHVHGPYPQFKFAYAYSAEDAFRKQCELFHECVGLENDGHPRPPHGLDLVCPCCQTSGLLERTLTA